MANTQSGSLTLNNCTVFGNQLVDHIAVPLTNYAGIENDSGTVTLNNSIVCSNLWNGTNSNVAPPAGGNNLVDANPMLMSLGDHGGPTLTMPPLPGSPAIDTGADSITNLLAVDQPILPRLAGPHVDIGAVEAEGAITLSAVASNSAAVLSGMVYTNSLPASYYFAYGLTTNYTAYTATSSVTGQFVGGSTLALVPLTTYHFQLVATSDSLGTSSGGDRTFTTPASSQLPTVSNFSYQVVGTNPVTGATTIQFSAYVDSHGSGAIVNFVYGLTSAYGVVSDPVNLPSSISASNITAAVSGFVPVNTYHWSVMTTNAFGIAIAADQNFFLPSSGIPGDLNGDGIVSQSEFDAVYTNYAKTSPWRYMTNVAGLGGTNVTFALSNSDIGSYTVQYSTNLTDWTTLGPAIPRFLFVDTNAPASPQRYYRLVFP